VTPFSVVSTTVLSVASFVMRNHMFSLRSTSYQANATIPLKHTHRSVAGGKNISPGFEWSDPPASTKSFAFSIIDPHPVAKNWIHWFIINIPFRERRLEEGASMTDALPKGTKELLNSYNEMGYGGPAPPKGTGAHPYIATLYALNVGGLSLGKSTTLGEFLRALEGKMIDEVSVTGYYERG